LCRLQMVGRYAIEALHVRFVEDHGSCRVDFGRCALAMHHDRAGRRRPIGEMSVPKCAKLLTMTKPDDDETSSELR
jgi:hypothetical protein